MEGDLAPLSFYGSMPYVHRCLAKEEETKLKNVALF